MVYVCEQWSQDGLRVWTVGDQSGSGHSGQYHDQHQASSHLQHIPAHGHTQHSHNSPTFISDAQHSLPSNFKLFLAYLGRGKKIPPIRKLFYILSPLYSSFPACVGKSCLTVRCWRDLWDPIWCVSICSSVLSSLHINSILVKYLQMTGLAFPNLHFSATELSLFSSHNTSILVLSCWAINLTKGFSLLVGSSSEIASEDVWDVWHSWNSFWLYTRNARNGSNEAGMQGS